MTAVTGYLTHVGLGEVADLAATHAVQYAEHSRLTDCLVTCECGQSFGSYSEHAFHLAAETIIHAAGRLLDPVAAFDHKYGKDDA